VRLAGIAGHRPAHLCLPSTRGLSLLAVSQTLSLSNGSLSNPSKRRPQGRGAKDAGLGRGWGAQVGHHFAGTAITVPWRIRSGVPSAGNVILKVTSCQVFRSLELIAHSAVNVGVEIDEVFAAIMIADGPSTASPSA